MPIRRLLISTGEGKVRRLLRMRVLDGARLQGQWVVAIDGSGYLLFRQRHCPHCLEWRCGESTYYLHQVLEAKLLGPEGLVISLGTVFIDTSDVADTPADRSLNIIESSLRSHHACLRWEADIIINEQRLGERRAALAAQRVDRKLLPLTYPPESGRVSRVPRPSGPSPLAL